ncbi:hypothetical protein BU26DRAFT_519768 [Trematosphaeria pertusa]|uniref:Uncharacterized protein n=1 Tax=Trematosphaeria pertusa TaxID=390896 RepID=A0A6A6ICP2_9PLEO|nr:uncharacterized protein BU26DRAFT_519768 [Trematosphaeria pertusa]KAF2247977.1 hypothetical protein BU26DRAFT_519768 [Trematosphaeria pertusa]
MDEFYNGYRAAVASNMLNYIENPPARNGSVLEDDAQELPDLDEMNDFESEVREAVASDPVVSQLSRMAEYGSEDSGEGESDEEMEGAQDYVDVQRNWSSACRYPRDLQRQDPLRG